MSRARIERLAALVAELGARRGAETSVPRAAEALQAAGFRVRLTWADGLSVDAAPGLHERLAELRAEGITPGLVAIIRDLSAEDVSEQQRAQQAGDRDWQGDASLLPVPATPNTRGSNPATSWRHTDG